MKNKIITSLLILISSFSYGQNSNVLRTETVDYCVGTNLCGKATYQCYEDSKTSNLIKHGTFKYVENRKDKYGSCSVIITGQFKNGFRDGLWSYSTIKKDDSNTLGSYTTGTLESIQNFKEGWPNGQWTINNMWKVRSLVYTTGGYIWGKFEEPIVESASTNFNNGIVTGLTSYVIDGKKHVVTLNKDGFLTGNLNKKSSIYKEEESFSPKGIMTKYIKREESTGEVVEKIDFDSALIQIGEKYLSGGLSKSDLKNMAIKVDTISRIFDDMAILFESDYFYLPGIDGDKSKTSQAEKRIYGRYLKFERVKFIPFEQHPKWAGTSISTNKKESEYKLFLEFYSEDISNEDISTIQNLIVQAKKQTEEENKNRELESKSFSEYSNLYQQKYRLLDIPNKPYKTLDKSFYNEFQHLYPKKIESKIKEVLYNIQKNLFAFKYNVDDFKSSGYVKSDNYTGSLSALREYTNHFNDLKPAIDSLAIIKSWATDIVFNVKDIECRYIINQDNLHLYNEYNESNPKRTNKTKLYNSYINVLEYLLNNSSNSTSFQESYNILQNLNNLCWYMVNVYDKKTTDVEKQLKNSVDTKSQLDIFLSVMKDN